MFTSGFGMVSECSRSRVPRPPQKSTTFIESPCVRRWCSGRFVGNVESLLLLGPQLVTQPVLRQFDLRIVNWLILGNVALETAIERNRHRQIILAGANLVAFDEPVTGEAAHA